MDPSRSRVASVDHPVVSPSGAFRLSLIEHVERRELTFQIESTSGVEVFRPEVAFSERARTYILWDDGADRVWVYSGDVGTTIWSWDGDAWQSQPWRGSGLTAPTFLRENVPKRFA